MTPPPSDPLTAHLTRDHRRLESLLAAAVDGERIDGPRFEEFRGGLLRHIGLEEKILLPAARRARGGDPLPIATQLRADHAAIAALLVPTPTAALVAKLRAILDAHDLLEEEAGGLYAQCDVLLVGEAEELLRRMEAAPAVPLAPHYDGERAFAGIERLLRAPGRAGV